MTYTAEDFRNDTPPRIMGSETEYTTDCLPGDTGLDSVLPVDIQCYYQFSRKDGVDLWLQNGARLYLDHGKLLEYATPEVTSAHEVLVHESIGERIVAELADNVIASADTSYQTHLSTGVYKRTGYDTISQNGTLLLLPMSDGHHENYTTPLDIAVNRNQYESYARRALSAYLATRPVWTGAGMVTENGYELSQKAQATDFHSTSNTGHGIKKPFQVKEDGKKLGRLEIRLGEGNMAEWVIVQKFALTSLVLRLIEHGKFPESLFLRHQDATNVMRRTSRRQGITTRAKYMTAAAHQGYIAQLGLDFAEKHDFIPQEEVKAAQEVVAACDAIDKLDEEFNGLSMISNRIDWAAKLDLMRTKGIEPVTAATLDAVQVDLKWENVRGTRLAALWYEKYGQPSTLTDSAMELGRQMPPATRALARTSFLASLDEHATIIDWSKVEVKNKIQSFSDPYQVSF